MPARYIGLKAIEARALAALKAGVDDAADDLAEAAEGMAPKLTGMLAGGIESDGAELSGTSVQARVHTGAGADEYAIIQHQRREGVKYLQIPLLAHAPVVAARVAAAARRRF